jgi:hypothetical protein
MNQNVTSFENGIYRYDFTQAADLAYGSNQNTLAPGIFGMIAGDLNADGTINEDDIILNWNESAGEPGYNQSDVDLDSQTDNIDKNALWFWNQGKFVILPE